MPTTTRTAPAGSYNAAAVARIPVTFHCVECGQFAARPADEGKVCHHCEWVAAGICTPEQPF